MLEILEFGCHIDRPDSEICNSVSRNILTTMVDETVQGASCVLSDLPTATLDSLPVFIPHFIYKTAILFIQELNEPERGDAKHYIRTFISILEYFGRRWVAGSMFSHG